MLYLLFPLRVARNAVADARPNSPILYMSGSQVASLFTQFTPSDLRATNHSHYHERGLLHAGRTHSAASKMLSQNFLLTRSDWQVNYGNPRNLFHDAQANLRFESVLGVGDRWIKSVRPICETIPTRSLKRQSKLQITFPSRSAASRPKFTK
jgi:hypothetical protein